MNVTKLLNDAVQEMFTQSCDVCPMYKACMDEENAICQTIADALEEGGKDD